MQVFLFSYGLRKALKVLSYRKGNSVRKLFKPVGLESVLLCLQSRTKLLRQFAFGGGDFTLSTDVGTGGALGARTPPTMLQ